MYVSTARILGRRAIFPLPRHASWRGVTAGAHDYYCISRAHLEQTPDLPEELANRLWVSGASSQPHLGGKQGSLIAPPLPTTSHAQ